MREDSPGPVGVVLVVPNVLLLGALVVEYLAVRPLFGARASSWQNEYDSGSMGIGSLGTLIVLLIVTLAALVTMFTIIVATSLGRGRLTALGWATLLAHLAILVSIWIGPAVPASTSEYWQHVITWAMCAVTGIVAGVSVRPPVVRRAHGDAG